MRGGRWQHLDRGKDGSSPSGSPRERAAADPAEGRGAAGEVVPPALHPALQLAAGYFHLKQYQQCADTLEAALRETPLLPGAHRLLGLSLGRLDDPEGAVRALERALEEDPEDRELEASLISAHLQTGHAYPPAVSRATGARGELVAASLWLRGRKLLEAGRPREAARTFGDAAELFAQASPPELAGERVAASLMGQAISYLVAGELVPAQQSYARFSRRVQFPESAQLFARQVYELAEEARGLTEAERAPALAPLGDLLLGVRLMVRFYDQVRPVAMHWEGMP